MLMLWKRLTFYLFKGVMMIREKLNYKKINEFIANLNEREKKYTIKRIRDEIYKNEYMNVNFTINNIKVIK